MSNDITRYDILKQLLENENPAFVFYTVMKHLSPSQLNETVDTCVRCGKMIRFIKETNDELNLKNYISEKQATGTGHDSLSNLSGGYSRFSSGKGHSAYDSQNEAFWKRVGEKISEMSGEDKRDYTGMMNLLQASCYMHNVIMSNISGHAKETYNTDSLIKNLDKKLSSGSDETIKNNIIKAKKQDSIEKATKTRRKNKEDKAKDNQIKLAKGGDEDAKKYLKKYYRKDYDKYFNESLYYSIFSGYHLDEAKDSFGKMKGMKKLDDYVNMMTYALAQLSDEDVVDIDTEISNYNSLNPYPAEPESEDTPERDDRLKFTNHYSFDNPVPYISIANDYESMDNMYRPCTESHNSKFSDHPERGNGRGGLKGLVGKTAGDDLTDVDLLNIANEINDMYDESVFNSAGEVEQYSDDYVRAMASVNFMGSTCLIFQYIRRGLLDKLKTKVANDLKKRHKGGWDKGNIDARDSRLKTFTGFGEKPMLGIDARRRK